MEKTKIVLIGAGSVCFGSCVIADIFLEKDLWGSTLSLVDIDPEALDRAGRLANKLNEHTGAGIIIETNEDRLKALPGAEFVINCVVIERNKYWQQDFEIPKKWGVRQTLGENGGPGGLFFTMRTIPLIMDIVHDMERLCPSAFFLNFSNPESRIILALGRYTKIRAVGLCHGVFIGHDFVARIMGREKHSIDVLGAGLNHFQWLISIRDSVTGEDLYPALREADKTFDPTFDPLCRKLFRAFGYYPSCGGGHVGEYLSFGYEAGEEGYNYEADEKHREWMKDHLEAIIAGTKPMEEFLHPSGERATQVITGIKYNKHNAVESGIIYNQGAIQNLPADAAVEVPITLDSAGVHPMRIGDLPEPIARLLRMQVSVQQMAVEAAANGSKEMALQALLMDPVVQSTKAAEGLLDELWQINEPFIRRCM